MRSLCAGRRAGAPQAQQTTDRFHLLQNLRQTIEQQLSRAEPPRPQAEPGGSVDLPEPPGLIHRYGPPEVTEHRRLVETGRRARSRAGFDRVKTLRAEGRSLADTVRETGFHWRTMKKWTRQETLPPRATMAPEVDDAQRVQHLSGASLERLGKQLLASPPSWLYRQPDPPATTPERLAARAFRCGDRYASPRCASASPHAHGSANCRRGAVHQTARMALSRQISIGDFRRRIRSTAAAIREQKQWSSSAPWSANRQYRIYSDNTRRTGHPACRRDAGPARRRPSPARGCSG